MDYNPRQFSENPRDLLERNAGPRQISEVNADLKRRFAFLSAKIREICGKKMLILQIVAAINFKKVNGL